MLLPVGTYTVDVTAHGLRVADAGERRHHAEPDDDRNFNLTPIPALEHDLTTLTDSNGNGKVEPGESFAVDERIVNTGHATATGHLRRAVLDDAGHHHHAAELDLSEHRGGRQRERTPHTSRRGHE